MTKNPRFQLLNNQFLRRLDELNWTIEGGNTQPTFYPTLESAWRSCINDNLLTAKTKKELGEIIKKLEELKKPFFKNK